jgi:pilus assembly protein CpaB
MADYRRLRHLSRRLFLRHRRLLAATLAAGSVVCLANVVAPHPPTTTPVLVASGDLAGGTVLSPDDVRLVRLPSELAPVAVLDRPDQAVDRILAAPVRKGEPLTDRRLVGNALVAGYGPTLVATPVRIADPDAVRLLEVGDHIDVYAVGSHRPGSGWVVGDAPVVALPVPSDDTSTDGALVVVAVSSSDAAALASASGESALSISVRG